MVDLKTPFEIEQAGQSLRVTPRNAGGSTVFVIHFPDRREPLALTRAQGVKKSFFWTSIPEGRQKEADIIGLLISAHYQGLTLAK